MNALRKYWWIALTSARSNLAYRGDIVGRLLFLAVILYVFLRLWQTTYGQTGASRLGGLSLAQMLWYLTMTEAVVLSAPRVSHAIDEDVRTGALAVQLLRPMSYGLYRLAATFGERFVRYAINLAAGALVALLLVGPAPSLGFGLLALAAALPLAFLLDFLGNFWIGLGAFWLEDTNGIFLLYSRLVMIAGGVMIPIELYPSAVQPLLRWLPFSNIASGPARIFVDPSATQLASLLVHQLVGASILAVCVTVTYRFALRRVFVNGG
ncbi:MAG TPA: ABC-2 family transporter protein [Planktothrix sp.]